MVIGWVPEWVGRCPHHVQLPGLMLLKPVDGMAVQFVYMYKGRPTAGACV